MSIKSSMRKYEIFTDGSCACNPGPAGYAAVIHYNNKVRIIKGHLNYSSNNRTELYAVVKALNDIKFNSTVIVYTDSQYVETAYNNGHIYEWMRNGWKRTKIDEQIQNTDLWQMLIETIRDRNLFVEFVKVKAHQKNYYNNLADRIAKQQAFLFQP